MDKEAFVLAGMTLPSWCRRAAHPEWKFILPFRERTRLFRRAYRAQQRDHSEVCGLLTADKQSRLHLVFFVNQSTRPGQFELDKRELRSIMTAAHARKEDVLGRFHSHPISAAIPGRGDMRGSLLNGRELVYDVCGREARLWKILKRKSRKVAVEVPLILETHSGTMRKQSLLEGS